MLIYLSTHFLENVNIVEDLEMSLQVNSCICKQIFSLLNIDKTQQINITKNLTQNESPIYVIDNVLITNRPIP